MKEIVGYDKLDNLAKGIIDKFLSSSRLDSFINKYSKNIVNGIRYECNFSQNHQKNRIIINYKKINDLRYINKYFERRNKNLIDGGILIGNFLTHSHLKKLLLSKYSIFLGYIIFILMLIFDSLSKLKFVKTIFLFVKKYSFFSKSLFLFSTFGNGRLISKAELFGRLYSCGFKVLDYTELDYTIFFVAKKISKPEYNLNPSHSFLIKLQRVGKNRKLFNVYKLRTMRPFSEYLQQYMYENYSLKDGGKIKDDFRISYIGRILRKFWIDELPMFANLIKGEMKLVGVRPLSEHYFNLYSEEIKNIRTKHNPGLIPPFYADLPKTLDEIMDSELKYLRQYERNPIITDLKYFFKCIYNIIFKGARSS